MSKTTFYQIFKCISLKLLDTGSLQILANSCKFASQLCQKIFFIKMPLNFFGKMSLPQTVYFSISNFWYKLTQPNEHPNWRYFKQPPYKFPPSHTHWTVDSAESFQITKFMRIDQQIRCTVWLFKVLICQVQFTVNMYCTGVLQKNSKGTFMKKVKTEKKCLRIL